MDNNSLYSRSAIPHEAFNVENVLDETYVYLGEEPASIHLSQNVPRPLGAMCFISIVRTLTAWRNSA